LGIDAVPFSTNPKIDAGTESQKPTNPHISITGFGNNTLRLGSADHQNA
jgi:hypothetical protein